MEKLEGRRLLSATASLNGNGVLTVVGTVGNDSIHVSQSGTDLSVSVGGTPLTITQGVNSLGTSLDLSNTTVRRVQIFGSAGNDSVVYDSNVTPAAVIREGNGVDTIEAAGTQPMAISANGGNDTLTLGNGNRVIGLGGGNDNITLGNGNNLLGYIGGNDTVTAGTGDDAIYASGGSNSHITVTGGSGNDLIYGGRGEADIDLSPASGASIVRLGRGNATLLTGAGNDLIFAEGGPNDSITTGSGNDTILTLQGNDTINATAGGDDEIIEVTADNTVTGTSGDTVWGSAAPDPNNSGILDANWHSTLPPHYTIQLVIWEALVTLV